MFVIDAAAALAAAGLTTPLLTRYLTRKRVLDIPNSRSSHRHPTPRGGGLSIVVTVLAATGVLAYRGLLPAGLPAAILGGGVFVAAVGLADDVISLPAWIRALCQTGAAAWSLWCLGVTGWIECAAAGFGLVWMINLYNFMDGIDGLAGAEAVFAGGAGAWLLGMHGQNGPAQIALIAAGAAAGFLIWNWPPAKIFLGDAGSGFLGFLFGLLAMASARQQPSALWCWVILLGVFEVDAGWTLCRRIWRGEAWYRAHRSHAYQHASRRFGSHGKVTIGVSAVNLLGLLPLSLSAAGRPMWAPAAALLALLCLVVLAIHFDAGEADSEGIKPRASSPDLLYGSPR